MLRLGMLIGVVYLGFKFLVPMMDAVELPRAVGQFHTERALAKETK